MDLLFAGLFALVLGLAITQFFLMRGAFHDAGKATKPPQRPPGGVDSPESGAGKPEPGRQ